MEEIHSTEFDHSAFGKRAAEIATNPDLLSNKEKLLDFWQLALEERTRNKKLQAQIADVAARTSPFGSIKLNFEVHEGDSYAEVILQFAYMDYLECGYYDEEADEEWNKLEGMLCELPEYRDK